MISINTILNQYKNFKISLQKLKYVFGEDLYNISDILPQTVNSNDIIYAIQQYLTNSVSLIDLLNWVNTIWFTDLYEYNTKEENTIASVMSLLETLDEGVEFSNEEYLMMIDCLQKNIECVL